jgi:hypothetical protein
MAEFLLRLSFLIGFMGYGFIVFGLWLISHAGAGEPINYAHIFFWPYYFLKDACLRR